MRKLSLRQTLKQSRATFCFQLKQQLTVNTGIFYLETPPIPITFVVCCSCLGQENESALPTPSSSFPQRQQSGSSQAFRCKFFFPDLQLESFIHKRSPSQKNSNIRQEGVSGPTLRKLSPWQKNLKVQYLGAKIKSFLKWVSQPFSPFPS